jgi:hypothetical protein
MSKLNDLQAADPLDGSELAYIVQNGTDRKVSVDDFGSKWVSLTQAAYDLLDPPDPDTLYVIKD